MTWTDRVSYATAGHDDSRVRVRVDFLDDNSRESVVGYLDTDLWGGVHFEIADGRGLRSIYRWDEVRRIVVVRPTGKRP